jgi:Cys-tRNA synthase (O-phospho-L-seryl-tRNA:Cys-tRNA synthase)
MELNVNVICNITGEILEEGVLLKNARIYIAKREGKIIKDEVIEIDLDDIDGGGQMKVRDMYVEFPEVVEEEKRWQRDVYNARKFWQYENDFGQER